MLKAILVDCIPLEMSPEEAENRLSEAESLIKTYGGVVLLKTYQKKISPVYKTYIGSGKLEELMEEGVRLGANIIIINNELKPPARRQRQLSFSLYLLRCQMLDVKKKMMFCSMSSLSLKSFLASQPLLEKQRLKQSNM